MAIDRIVFDTNNLISAAISPLGKPFAAVRWIVERGRPVTSKPLLDEVTRRLRRPRIVRVISEPHATELLRDFLAVALLVEPAPLPPTCRDPDDDVVLATALAAGADCIVTGDEDLLVLDPFRGIRILTPAAFMDAVAAAD
ncbi:MAG TPA: putative toxin-antitoxin system toxin component, PIN family [Hyphomicrobiaceae bacterium]|nr:putative toxin-antitoxin system toxin component, PIN family [Hyphomicrobiaceae bacterium]